MATSTQTNFDKVANADAHQVGVDGGLNLKSEKARLAPPQTTRADNASYFSPGTVQQLPAFGSQMPAGVQHIYNLHARDTLTPSITGDVMIHGELADSNGSTTTPIWMHAQGAGRGASQPVIPWSMRTRTLGNKLTQTYSPNGGGSLGSGGSTDLANVSFARQELSTSSAARRFAMGAIDATGAFTVVFGLCDGMQETGETLTASFGFDFIEMTGIQGSANWALFWQSGGTIFRRVYDFFGNLVSGDTTMTVNAMPVPSTGQRTANVTTFHHAGSTYLGIVANNSPFRVFVTPALGTPSFTQVGTMSTTSPTTGAFAIASPTTHQAPAVGAVTYLAITFNGQMYVVTNPLSGPSFTSTGVTIPGPQQGPSGGRWNTLATSAVSIADGGNGMSATSRLVLTTFSHVAEYVAPLSYQTVLATTLSFQAVAGAAGTMAFLGSNVFRAPGGVALAAKAFTASPSESGFSGATRAVQTYVAVRMGGVELDPQAPARSAPVGSYGQPTYFLIDQMARPVARWFEGIAPIGGYTTVYRATSLPGTTTPGYTQFPLPYALGQCLISDGLASSDVSALDIQVPGWAQTTIINPGGAGSFPTSLTFTPSSTCLSLSSSASHVPAVQGGPYTVCSGALTCIHDGRGLTEANYHAATFNLSVGAPSTPASSALGSAQTYSYQAIYIWTDNVGRLHRSAPSATVTFTPSGQFFGATVMVPPPITNKTVVGGPITCKLYRTSPSSPGNYFEVGSQTIVNGFGTGGAANTYTLTFLDNFLYDATILNQPLGSYARDQGKLYVSLDATTNQPLAAASTPPPGFLWQTSTKGRIYGLAQVLGQFRIYYSSQLLGSGLPYEWNANNYVPVPADMGDVRSIETIDDKVYVLGTRQNAVFNGDGPDNGLVAGPGYGFSAVTPIPTPSGIIGTGSPSRTPDGIVFQGGQGIQQIGRDGTVSPAGAQVEPITGRQANNPGVILGRATTLPLIQSVVWANPRGPALVYNYLAGKWSTWPLLSGANVVAQRMDQTGFVSSQPITGTRLLGPATASTPGTDFGALGSQFNPVFTNSGSSAALVLETPWLLPSGESGGEGALWDVMVTGEWLGPHILQVEQAYNYQPYNAPSQLSWPTTPLYYMWRVRPLQTSRVWAVRYRVSLLPMTTLQAGYLMANITDLVVNFGQKQGTSRLGMGQSG